MRQQRGREGERDYHWTSANDHYNDEPFASFGRELSSVFFRLSVATVNENGRSSNRWLVLLKAPLSDGSGATSRGKAGVLLSCGSLPC